MLQVVDKNLVVLAYLNNALEGSVTEVLNGEYIISFVVSIDELKTPYLYNPENYVMYNDDLFKVTTIQEIHSSDDYVRVSVQCEHKSYDLLNTVFENFIFEYKPAIEVFQACLQGTEFVIGECDITDKTSIQYTQECNAKQISIAIASNWKGELKYYRNRISLLKSRGKNRGIAFIFGRNLRSVKRNIDFVKEKVSYEVDITKNSELEELAYYELGDIVRVIDETLNVDTELKIIEVETDIVTGLNNVVRLGDSIEDMRSSFSKVTDKISEGLDEVKGAITEGALDWNKINDIINSNGEIVIGKVNELEGRVSKIINSTGTFIQTENYSYWQDQPSLAESTFASMWGPKGMAYATQKDVNGEWIWTSIFDGEGVIANQVTANALTGITINGVQIVGSSILAGDIAMTGKITWGPESSPMKAQYSIDGSSNWHDNLQSGDKFARYSYDGGITWTQAIKTVGTDGVKGEDGRSSYFHIKYSPVANPTVGQMTETPNTYIGTYVDFNPEDSNDPASYKWQRLEGSQGPQGNQGIPGYNGADGRTTYLHIKYSDYSNPSASWQMSENLGAYIGQYTDFEPNDSDDPYRYTWTRIKGDQGPQGPAGSDANIPNYIKQTYIDSVEIKSPTITGGQFKSFKTDGSYMLLDGGEIVFRQPSTGQSGYYDSDSATLFGPNGSILVMDTYESIFGISGTTVSGGSGHDFAIGQRGYQNNMIFTKNGNVQINAPFGYIWLSASSTSTPIYMDGAVEVSGSLYVSGDKSAMVPTQHYGTRALYADESDRSYFSTKGLVDTVNGEFVVELDPIFMETIELNSVCPYVILLTPYSDARVWIDSVEDNRFVIKSDKDTKVAYDLKAIRISYQNVYLQEKQVDKKRLELIQQAAVERMSV